MKILISILVCLIVGVIVEPYTANEVAAIASFGLAIITFLGLSDVVSE